jgi:hypothetical protein
MFMTVVSVLVKPEHCACHCVLCVRVPTLTMRFVTWQFVWSLPVVSHGSENVVFLSHLAHVSFAYCSEFIPIVFFSFNYYLYEWNMNCEVVMINNSVRGLLLRTVVLPVVLVFWSLLQQWTVLSYDGKPNGSISINSRSANMCIDKY